MMVSRRTGMARWLAAPALAGFAPVAFALCSGFTDVDGASGFCPSIDWLRNRAITVGCTSNTVFCPDSTVTRLQMAAFMNRLGNALTPTIVYQQESNTTLDLSSAPTVCITGALDAAAYPRAASFGAVLNMLAGAATGVQLDIAISIDDGATWVPQGTSQQMSGSGTARWVNGTTWQGNIPLAPNTAYRFGLRVSGQSGTAALNSWSCQLKGIVASRSGSGAPF
jgi:hypothetical protein